MASINKYYIVNLPEPALDAIITHTDMVATSVDNVRFNNNGTKALIKTKHNVTAKPNVLPASSNAMTHAEMKVEMAKAEWSPVIEM